MITIRKSDPKYNAWLKRHNERKFQREVDKRKCKRRSIYSPENKNTQTQPSVNLTNTALYSAIAPQNFSVIDNPNETVTYFNQIIEKIMEGKNGLAVYFNFENITYLTIDSVMYLLAVLKNIKRGVLKQYHFFGNFPKDETVNNLLEDSGFLDYMEVKNKTKIEKNSEQITIKSGKIVNQGVVKEICDFVNKKFGTNKVFTRFLYNMIIELMTNTIQHAYNDNNCMANYWYIFVKNDGDSIKFIFLDTGSGIPQTIRKKLYESIIEKSETV